ncbi:MAG TPA: hypothetical protein VM901_13275 [Bdellovibrionota bacterium]|nr:hypothetical protein [Bdellovibrionota bacterium]
MKTAKLIALSTLMMAAQSFAKGGVTLAYQLDCNLGTRTKVTETFMNFVERAGTMGFKHQVLSDIFEPVLPEPFHFSMVGATPATDTEVKVTNTESVFLVSAYEIRDHEGRPPEVLKEFELEAKKIGATYLDIKKLLIDGVDHLDDVGPCSLRVIPIGP